MRTPGPCGTAWSTDPRRLSSSVLGSPTSSTSVNFAKGHDLLVAVRGGGHNAAGNAVCDDGLVIDLSLIKGVRVDPLAQTVRADGGVTIGELDHESQAFGLAVPMGVVTETGIAGLTLAGGIEVRTAHIRPPHLHAGRTLCGEILLR